MLYFAHIIPVYLYATWAHDDICTAAAEVRKEIADETDRETGRSKAISSVPIHLSIFSPYGKYADSNAAECLNGVTLMPCQYQTVTYLHS